MSKQKSKEAGHSVPGQISASAPPMSSLHRMLWWIQDTAVRAVDAVYSVKPLASELSAPEPSASEPGDAVPGRWLFFGFSAEEAQVCQLSARFEALLVWSADAPSSQLTAVLGDVFDGVVFNAWAGFHPDRLALLSGTLRGGGLLVLISPTAQAWPVYRDPEYQRLISDIGDRCTGEAGPKFSGHYLRRLVRCLLKAQAQGKLITGRLPAPCADNTACPSSDILMPTPDQQAILDALLSEIQPALTEPRSDRSGPVCLVAGARGRGKSQVLAYLLEYLQNHPSGQEPAHCLSVVMIVPHMAAAATLQRYAPLRSVLDPQPGCERASLRLEFCTPVSWLTRGAPAAADVMLIEEAATLPFSVLQSLLAFKGPVVLATTTIGYEGSGRVLAEGFVHWLMHVLNGAEEGACFRTFHRWTLDKPLRWSASDPLEKLLNDILLLDTPEDVRAQLPPRFESAGNDMTIAWVTQSTLSDASQLLAQVWALLYGAHYRTRPSDLRALLDQPNVKVLIARQAERVVGAAWFVLEGPFSADLATDTLNNKRRPKGHLLPQLMALRLGYGAALTQRHLRCVRIAVDPVCRRQGIAQRLLQAALDQFESQVASIGASCALQPETAEFWQACGYQLLRLGVKPNARSGAVNFAVFRPCSVEMKQWALVHQALFWRHWPAFSKHFASPAIPSLISCYKPTDICESRVTSARDELGTIGLKMAGLKLDDSEMAALKTVESKMIVQRLRAFARGTAEEADVAGLLAGLFKGDYDIASKANVEDVEKQLGDPALNALQRHVCEGNPWAEFVNAGVFSSKKQAIKALRAWVSAHVCA